MPIQKGSFYSDGLRFSCTECSLCCRFDSGYVFLSRIEIDRLAERFSLTAQSFIDQYCRVVDMGFASRVTLREQKNLDCVFWKHGGCSVYEDRPLQCRSFPFWPAHLAGCAARGIVAALVNSAVCGAVGGPLAEGGIPATLLVHELPRLLAEKAALAAARSGSAARRIVFAAPVVRDAVATLAPFDPDIALVLPQGNYRCVA